MTIRNQTIMQTLPSSVDAIQLMNFLDEKEVNSSYWKTLKDFTNLNDVAISSLFSISVKTYRSYRGRKPKQLAEKDKEQIVALLTLFKHGKEVFGTIKEFMSWLIDENFFFDGNSPDKSLKTISGIKFIDDRLTGMEYGDNV